MSKYVICGGRKRKVYHTIVSDDLTHCGLPISYVYDECFTKKPIGYQLCSNCARVAQRKS
jgi:hypothetical protein